MSLIHNTAVPSVSQHMTGHNADTKGCDETVNQLCQLYPEIASWQPALIAGAWHQWCAENQRQPSRRKNVMRRFPVPRQAYPQQNGGDERMALISCFTGPQGLQGMLTCLRDTEGMTGILVVVALLAGWIVVQYLADARRERRAWESRPGIPSSGAIWQCPTCRCGSCLC
jgi:hypothetical protein